MLKNIFKYNYITKLEEKYNNYFKFASSITILPPILKKVGVIYYLSFLVIENSCEVKRPIGVILVNKITGQEKTYDLYDYDFAPKYTDFEYVYYNSSLCQNYFPNLNAEMEENIKVMLDKLATLSNKYFNMNEDEYNKYLSKLKDLFPTNYFIFFEELQNNNITPITEKIKAQRDLSKIKNSLSKATTSNERLIENLINKKVFKKIFRENETTFIKNEILPELRGNGSYNKLTFYFGFGEYYKNFIKELNKYYSCYGYEFNEKEKHLNTNKCFENEEKEIKKIMYNSAKNSLSQDNMIDTLSKILIVFINSLLIEKIHNAKIDEFEQQIKDCIDMFNENINKIFDFEAKDFLSNLFYELTNIYYNNYYLNNNDSNCDNNSNRDNNKDIQTNNCNYQDLSLTFYGYLIIHFPFEL